MFFSMLHGKLQMNPHRVAHSFSREKVKIDISLFPENSLSSNKESGILQIREQAFTQSAQLRVNNLPFDSDHDTSRSEH